MTRRQGFAQIYQRGCEEASETVVHSFLKILSYSRRGK
jgi:hypothetical protein